MDTGDVSQSSQDVSLPRYKLHGHTSLDLGSEKIQEARFVEGSGANFSQFFLPLIGVSGILFLIAVGVIATGGMRQQGVRASVNFAKSIQGSVSSVESDRNRFMILYSDSADTFIRTAGLLKWTVMLPPGERLTGDVDSASTVCRRVDSLSGPLTHAAPIPCRDLLIPGTHILVEYLSLNISDTAMVAKVIIGKMSGGR